MGKKEHQNCILTPFVNIAMAKYELLHLYEHIHCSIIILGGCKLILSLSVWKLMSPLILIWIDATRQ